MCVWQDADLATTRYTGAPRGCAGDKHLHLRYPELTIQPKELFATGSEELARYFDIEEDKCNEMVEMMD